MSHNNQTGSSFDEKTGRWNHCFSQSFLGEMQLCSESARASYFREVERQHTDATALGTAVHGGIEYGLTEKRDGNVVHIDDCIEVARLELEECRPWQKNKLTEERIQDLIPTMLLAWERQFLPDIQPTWIEEEFKFEFHADDKRVIHLSGTADTVDHLYMPWDWKTASRAYEAWEKQRWNVQATVYCLAAQRLAGGSKLHEPYPFLLAVMTHDGGTQSILITRTQAHVEWLRMQCLQTAQMIESGIKPWPLNDGSWKCSPLWCAKFQECKGSVGIDEPWAQIKERAA